MTAVLHVTDPIGTPLQLTYGHAQTCKLQKIASHTGSQTSSALSKQRLRIQPPSSLLPPVSRSKDSENRSPLLRLKSGERLLRSGSGGKNRTLLRKAYQGQLQPRNFTNIRVPKTPGPEREGWKDSERDAEDKRSPLNKESYSRPTNMVTGASASTSELIDRPREVVPTPQSQHWGSVNMLSSSSVENFQTDLVPDRSSDFVHSMKTASFTNATFSICSRSKGRRQSSGSHCLSSSQPRCSNDSHRPLSNASIDDLAIKRGFARQTIIDELIDTEESYVADLRALAAAQIDLLSRSPTISPQSRRAITTNLENILLLHETISNDLRKARLDAAARRWVDAAIPVKVRYRERGQLQGSDHLTYLRALRVHRHIRSSIDSCVGQSAQYSEPAEPLDILEIVRVFDNLLPELYVYEEYCANYHVVVDELHRQPTTSRLAYDSGLESLSRMIFPVSKRRNNGRKGLTFNDLLIKPIQRITKYPLLLEDLLRNTPCSDAPTTHSELEQCLQALKAIIHRVNLATDNQHVRAHIQRKRLLQDRLSLHRLGLSTSQFQGLGFIELCGVLYMTYQTSQALSGRYAVLVLFGEHLMICLPLPVGDLEAIALLRLSDIGITSAVDGKGLQCASTRFTWKVSFTCCGYIHEFLLSACSQVEETAWTSGLRGQLYETAPAFDNLATPIPSRLAFHLKSSGVVFTSNSTLSRSSSVQRASTVGNRPAMSQVIIRNTHNAHDANTEDYRINRSLSHLNTKRIPDLEPKRSDRLRLENSISDIWTKDRLPFPGLIGARTVSIFRASADTLVRKLSLASISSTFSRGRTSSLSMHSSHRKSSDILDELKPNSSSTFRAKKRNASCSAAKATQPKEVPEVDDMKSVVDRMMGISLPTKGSSLTDNPSLLSQAKARSLGKAAKNRLQLRPDDPADVFYQDEDGEGRAETLRTIQDGSTRTVEVTRNTIKRKKRLSDSFMRLKTIAR